MCSVLGIIDAKHDLMFRKGRSWRIRQLGSSQYPLCGLYSKGM